jgi:outer membrane scaffolding protein for murein synthesis (MipA/OmpV family)
MLTSLAAIFVGAAALPYQAQAGDAWWSGDWYVKVGATGFVAPRYDGARAYLLKASPLVSVGKSGSTVRFSSRTDNPSFALFDTGPVRAGIVGKLVMPRTADDSSDLKGLKAVKLGLEAGAFAEFYPAEYVRLRAEVRQGIRSHRGIVADLSADAFTDITPEIRVSAGPRLTLATANYVDAYYGVNAKQSAKSGLSRYDAEGGVYSAGIATEINWKATEHLEAGAFAEYKRLLGPAADSSLVRERGTRNQFLVGISTTYKFGFTLD